MTDADLWKQIQQGDNRAFEELYRRYYSPLLAYGVRLSFDTDTVQDCIQNLFVKLYVQRQELSHITYIKSYLYRALINALTDKAKSISYNHTVSDEFLFDISIEDEGLSRLFAQNDADLKKMSLLKNAIRQLSAKQKNMLYFRIVKEASWEETAEICAITPHSCMNLFARTVEKIRSLIWQTSKNNSRHEE